MLRREPRGPAAAPGWTACSARLQAATAQGGPGGGHRTEPGSAAISIDRPNRVWVTGIIYARTYEGWLYPAVVIDLFSRHATGWSIKPSLAREIALDALLMAIWRRRRKQEVIIHSDRASKYGSGDWLRFLKAHNLKACMGQRGNCRDDAMPCLSSAA
jgi:transposase InsO family protein